MASSQAVTILEDIQNRWTTTITVHTPHSYTSKTQIQLILLFRTSRSPQSSSRMFPSRPQMAIPSHREINVYMAKVAEQAERYDDMADFLEKLVLDNNKVRELSVEERNLLYVAYKNKVGARRSSWRTLQKELGRDNADQVALVREYRAEIESELSSICGGVLRLLDSHLLPSAYSAESKVFYLKMKGDYYRYLAEFKSGTDGKEDAENTLSAYKSAQVRSSTYSLFFLRYD
jgi:hypothetical protein